LRSETALTQTCGRAARNANGRVIMYADKETKSIKNTIDVTQNRRKIQEKHNQKHGIIPKTVHKNLFENLAEGLEETQETGEKKEIPTLDPKELSDKVKECEKEMKLAAKELRFEDAARFRDLVKYYQDLQLLEDSPY
jgi:excinuclease ABC subunit B